jgi:hypothetical protein
MYFHVFCIQCGRRKILNVFQFVHFKYFTFLDFCYILNRTRTYFRCKDVDTDGDALKIRIQRYAKIYDVLNF